MCSTNVCIAIKGATIFPILDSQSFKTELVFLIYLLLFDAAPDLVKYGS